MRLHLENSVNAVVGSAAALSNRDVAGFHWCVWVFLTINPDGDIARVAAAGTASDVTAKLKRFYDAGARHFVFLASTAGTDQRPVLDRLCTEVIPALREHATRS